MAICFISKKTWMGGNKVSHSNIKTKRHIRSNITKRNVYDTNTQSFFRVALSAKGLKVLEKVASLEKCLKKR